MRRRGGRVVVGLLTVAALAGCGGGGSGSTAGSVRSTSPLPTTVPGTAAVAAPRLESPVDQLVGVGDAEQVISVIADAPGETTATLTTYERSADGWVQVRGPMKAFLGGEGFAPVGQKREGDNRTPTGAYDLGFAFGVLADPGVRSEYRRITSDAIVWDDDPSSRRYNEWVDTSTESVGVDPEPMYNPPAYNYGVVIDYNAERTPGLGSAIFLHVAKDGPTAGCVAIPQGDLVDLMRWLDPAKRPRIVMGTRDAVTTTAAPDPAPTTAPAAGPPYVVDVVDTTVVDPTRPTAARGPTPASSSRTLPVRVYVPRTPGRVPLVVFAHGYDIAAADYGALVHGLAGQGFVVVAPDFPLSSTVFPGPPTQADIDHQARDVAFLVDAFVDDRVQGVWSGKVAPGEAGVVGHSDGGNTAARVASNSCCIAPRIGAAAVLSGDEGTSGGEWGVGGSAPMLFVQGTADTVNPWSFSQRLYDDAASPKTIVAIDGGDHLAPYVAAPERIVALVAAFLRGHLAADAAARAQVTELANRDGLRLAASS